jgi:hypothetical protein
VRGRVLDLQGRPVAGARVWVEHVISEKGKDYLAQKTWAGLSPDVRTDAAGRFVLGGIGRGREAWIHVQGAGVEHKFLPVSTVPAGGGSGQPAEAEIVVGPTKPIEGVVRAADTGEPVAGAWVFAGHFGGEVDKRDPDNYRAVRTRTDDRGHFRLEGMRKLEKYLVAAFPREDQPYLWNRVEVGDTPGLEPARTEVTLFPGVPVSFRVVDAATRRPLLSYNRYIPCDDSPYFTVGDFHRFMNRNPPADADGYYRLVVAPGTGAIKAFIPGGKYRKAVRSPADLQRYPLLRPGAKSSYFAASMDENIHGYRMLDLKPGDRPAPFDIEVTPGPVSEESPYNIRAMQKEE